jgi:hypothetical protein
MNSRAGINVVNTEIAEAEARALRDHLLDSPGPYRKRLVEDILKAAFMGQYQFIELDDLNHSRIEITADMGSARINRRHGLQH